MDMQQDLWEFRKGSALTFASAELKADRDSRQGCGPCCRDTEWEDAGICLYGFTFYMLTGRLTCCRDAGWQCALSRFGGIPGCQGGGPRCRGAECDIARVFLDGIKGRQGVALAAVAHGGCALQYVSAQLQSDKAVVLVAVANCGCALKFSTAELMADRQVVLTAVAHWGFVERMRLVRAGMASMTCGCGGGAMSLF